MKMNCKKAEEYLVDYLYQELPAKKTLEIEKHLAECSHCTGTLESWRAIHRAYQRSTEEPLVAPYTKQKVLAMAEQELLRARPWSEKFVWALKLTAVPLAIFILVLFFNSKNQNEIARYKPQAEPAPPLMSQADKRVETPAPQQGSTGGRQQETLEPAPKRREEPPVFADELSSRLKEEERVDVDKNALEKKKDESVYANRDAAAPAPSAPPAASAPTEIAAEEDEYETEQLNQKAAKISAVSSDMERPFQEAQKQLQSKNVKEGQKLLNRAVALDDKKTLASQLHQEGNSYQSRGEYVNAIIQFEKVQANYRDYARMDEVLIRLGDSYAEVGQFDKAVHAYSQVRSQKNVAAERIQRLQKKQEANEQLKALGYVSDPKKE